MDEREKAFAFVLMMYVQYKLFSPPPPPFHALEDETGFAVILLLNLYYQFLQLVRIPLPLPDISLRYRILEDEEQQPLTSNDIYSAIRFRPYEFWILSGETVQSFRELVIMVSNHIENNRFGNSFVTIENRVLLTLIWLRQYPTYTLLSLTFGISVPNVGKIINNTWIVLWELCSPIIQWPSVHSWRRKRGKWVEMPNVVGSIDGTSHEILIPLVEPQQEFYSDHRKYHCIHTQVIIDNEKNICYVHSGFLGHENDAHAYQQIGPIGSGQPLDFPDNCYLLADSIYPNAVPLVVPYKNIEIIRQPARERQVRRRFNRLHKSRRVYVEHVMKELKTFRIIGSLYRHPRWQMASIVELCAGLAKRRADLLDTI